MSRMPRMPSIGALSAAAALVAICASGTAAADARGPGAAAKTSVIGGTAPARESMPWLAYIADFRAGEEGICSGTVVAADLVLTAAHCVESPEAGGAHPAAGFRVVTGSLNWTSPRRELAHVIRVLVFPGYQTGGPSQGWGDAALLQLATPTRAPPIALASADTSSAGPQAVIAGWGLTSYAEHVNPALAHSAPTAVESDAWCDANAPGFRIGGELCTVSRAGHPTGLCDGDSGGPLLQTSPADGGFVEIGVATLAYAGCSTAEPDVFTRSDVIASWVAAEIAELPARHRGGLPHAPRAPHPRIRLSTAAAAGYLRTALRNEVRSPFAHHERYSARCRRVSRTRQRCAVSWRVGPNHYRGVLAVHYALENLLGAVVCHDASAAGAVTLHYVLGGELLWTNRYPIHWASFQCTS